MSDGRSAKDAHGSDAAEHVPDVPAGYRHTEVGVIPCEWLLMRIGDLFESRAGGDFDPSRSSELQSANHPYPIYANGLSKKGLYGFCDYAQYRPTCITVTARGTLGKAVYRGTEFVAIGRLLVLDPKVNMDSRYFTEFINYGVHFAVESTGVPQLTAPQVARYLLPVPPEFEQCSISDVLSDVNDLIGELETLIAKKRAIKQATMQHILTGKTRLPGFGREWTSVALGQILTVRHGRSHQGLVAKHGPYSVLGSGGLIGRTHRSIFANPSVLIGRKGTITKPQFMSDPFWAVDTLFYTDIEPCASPKFLYYLFCQIDWLMYNEASGLPSLNSRTIERIVVAIPTLSEQRAIATVLSDMDTEIAALERRLDKTRSIKQGMMQQLLTGAIRLPVQDDSTEGDAHGA